LWEIRNRGEFGERMTQKAEQIMKRIREMDQKKRLALMNNPHRRTQVMESINRADQDEPSRVGTNDQEMKILRDINELQDFENDNWSRGTV
jgi:hypothetical protein